MTKRSRMRASVSASIGSGRCGLQAMIRATLRPDRPRIGIMSTVVRARIDEKTREEAAAVLGALGLTVSDAFRLMMVRIATDKRLPFEPLAPNSETVEAMKAARRGELVAVGDVDGLMADLNADDQADLGLQTRLQTREERPVLQDAGRGDQERRRRSGGRPAFARTPS